MNQLVPGTSVAMAVLILGTTVLPGAVRAQTGRDSSADTLAGLRGFLVVEPPNTPLAGAFLYLEGTDYATRTDSLGRFDFGRVPPGAHQVTVHHPLWQVQGMAPPSAIFSVVPGETTELEWVLLPPSARGTELDPIPLEGLTATADLAVERRRTEGSSMRYIGSAEIAEFRGRGLTVADLIRDRIASLRTMPTRSGFGMECVQTRRMGEDGLQILHQRVNAAPDCPEQVALLVDGMRILDPSAYLPALSLDVVESVEFVPGVVAGARFGTGFAGGVLVVETRVR